MTDDGVQRLKDADEHKQSYDAIMRAGAEVGVPFAMALTMFFTNLVMANGFLLALFAGIVTHIFVYFVVKTFFSH